MTNLPPRGGASNPADGDHDRWLIAHIGAMSTKVQADLTGFFHLADLSSARSTIELKADGAIRLVLMARPKASDE